MTTVFQGFSEELQRLGSKHKSLVLLDARRSSMGREGFLKVFSDRYVELDRCGEMGVGRAIGFALTEKLPILFADAESFLRGIEAIQDTMCKSSLNVKMIGIGDPEIVQVLRRIQGLEVFFPENFEEALEVLQALPEHYGPVYVHLGV